MYAVEEALINRIKAAVPSIPDVGSVSHFHAAYEVTPDRAIYVQPSKIRGRGDPGEGRTQMFLQDWLIAVVVVNRADEPTPAFESTAKDAGTVLATVAQTLVGWRPLDGWLPFDFKEGEDPVFDSGFGDFAMYLQTGARLTN